MKFHSSFNYDETTERKENIWHESFLFLSNKADFYLEHLRPLIQKQSLCMVLSGARISDSFSFTQQLSPYPPKLKACDL